LRRFDRDTRISRLLRFDKMCLALLSLQRLYLVVQTFGICNSLIKVKVVPQGNRDMRL
jgi:hypothetical protein